MSPKLQLRRPGIQNTVDFLLTLIFMSPKLQLRLPGIQITVDFLLTLIFAIRGLVIAFEEGKVCGMWKCGM